MRTHVAVCFLILFFLFLLLPALSFVEKVTGSTDVKADEGESSKTTPKAKKTICDVVSIRGLVQAGRYGEAIDQWEWACIQDRASFRRYVAWDVAQAYVKQEAYEKAIAMYKPEYHFITESIEQRAELGEVLLFGEVDTRPTKENNFKSIGKGQCHLCHQIFKESVNVDLVDDPFQPYLFDFAHRIKGLIASPKYQHRPQNTEQPEAFPASGKATNLIEYLAESNVCPSCYIVPRIGFADNDRQSIMPKIHKPPISLTIDEMIAIDTWLLRREGEKIPSLEVMRAAYEKFLRPEDRPVNKTGIFLASLYDAKGNVDEAIQLLRANYKEVLLSAEDETWGRLRNDPDSFRNLKERSDMVEKFPKILRADSGQ